MPLEHMHVSLVFVRLSCFRKCPPPYALGLFLLEAVNPHVII